MQKLIFTSMVFAFAVIIAKGQTIKPEDTEVWSPEPKSVSANRPFIDPPSDAIVLFDGSNIDQWVSTQNRDQPGQWVVHDGILTVKKGTGNIETKQLFTNYQLHVEWQIPANISGEGQARGNSGLFLASLGKGDAGYELQVLDSYNNKTYVNGMAGSLYKQTIPLANAAKKPGEWQSYDVIWMMPVFNEDGSVKVPAKVTVFFNGVLVENNMELAGPTLYIGKPAYQKHGATPIKLQAHGDKSEPVSFRNIWIRQL